MSERRRINTSLLDFFGQSLPPIVPIGFYVDTMRGIGTNLDLFPTNSVAGVQSLLGLASRDELNAINVVNGSFRSENSIIEALRHPNRSLALFAFFLFPHKDNLKILEATTFGKDEAGQDAPIVILYEDTARKSAEKLTNVKIATQIYYGMFEKHGIKTSDDINRYLADHKLDGFSFDTFHSRFLLEMDSKLVDAVLDKVLHIGISLGRNDLKDPYHASIDTFSELTDVLFNSRHTKIFDLIKNISDKCPNAPISIKIPESGLSHVTGQSMNFGKLYFLHKRIVNNLKKALN